MAREIHKMASLRRQSSLWRPGDDVFSRSSSRFQDEEDDEEALRWAALERLPTYDRVRRGILTSEEGEKVDVDVGRLGARESRALIERLIRAADEDHERFLLKLRERMDSSEAVVLARQPEVVVPGRRALRQGGGGGRSSRASDDGLGPSAVPRSGQAPRPADGGGWGIGDGGKPYKWELMEADGDGSEGLW